MRAASIVSLGSKSTSVRSDELNRFPNAVGVRWTSLQLLSSFAPSWAARWAARIFLTPPAPRPLSRKARDLFARADDRFTVKLETAFGGQQETSGVHVALWGRGPAVYFLHGWGGRASQWISFVEPVVAAGLTAVVLDAPGHGDSRAPRTSILHFAAALAAVVESVGPARGVVGHSLGGDACALALRRGLETKSAVLIGTPADPVQFFRQFLQDVGVHERLHGFIRADVERRYGFRWSDLAVRAPVATPELPALVVHDRADTDVRYEDADRIVRAELGRPLGG